MVLSLKEYHVCSCHQGQPTLWEDTRGLHVEPLETELGWVPWKQSLRQGFSALDASRARSREHLSERGKQDRERVAEQGWDSTGLSLV